MHSRHILAYMLFHNVLIPPHVVQFKGVIYIKGKQKCRLLWYMLPECMPPGQYRCLLMTTR